MILDNSMIITRCIRIWICKLLIYVCILSQFDCSKKSTTFSNAK